MRCCAAVCGLMLLTVLATACSPQYYHVYSGETQSQAVRQPSPQKPVQVAQAEQKVTPKDSCWPELTLIGLHPKKLEMTLAEFIEQGWDPSRIKTATGESSDKVRAVVRDEGYVDIPTSDQVLVKNLCSTQKAAIRGMVDYYRCSQ